MAYRKLVDMTARNVFDFMQKKGSFDWLSLLLVWENKTSLRNDLDKYYLNKLASEAISRIKIDDQKLPFVVALLDSKDDFQEIRTILIELSKFSTNSEANSMAFLQAISLKIRLESFDSNFEGNLILFSEFWVAWGFSEGIPLFIDDMALEKENTNSFQYFNLLRSKGLEWSNEVIDCFFEQFVQ